MIFLVFKRGNVPWNTGLTKETDSRIKPSWNTGLSKETDSRIKSSWNRGLPKEQQPWYGRKHSKESIVRISETHRRAFREEGRVTWNKGLTKETDSRVAVSDEARRNMSLAGKGRVISQETRDKISKVKTGKKRAPFSEEWKEKISQAMMGRVFSEEHKRKIGEANTKRVYSEETKRKISQGLKKYYQTHDGFNKGKHLSDETKQKLREANLRQKPHFRNTSIERLVKTALIFRGVNFFQEHVGVCGVCQPDVVFPEQKIAVFCDGDYWHNRPESVKRDTRQDRVLRENGWIPLRFWEHEINGDVNKCVDQIISLLGAS